MSFKIAFIGAGSIGFTRGLMRDLFTVPELRGIEVSFHDISAHNLAMVEQLCARDIAANGIAAKLTATTDRRAALAGARYVFCVARIGGLEAFATDVEIPLRYGVDQAVGDTLCAGGIMYGQRGIAAMLDFCRDIREVAAPGCVLFNYANPMAMMTWAANNAGVTTIGLCHGVEWGQWLIAQVVKHWARTQGVIGAEDEVEPKEVDILAAGINHQTWFLKAQWRGIDLIPRMLELFEMHPTSVRTERVRIDMLRRFGYFSTESNGHLSEYVPWYRKRADQLKDWIDLDSWCNGETGGYLRVCNEGRDWFETDFPAWLQEPAWTFDAKQRTHERGSYLIEALETGRMYRGHVNVRNQGCIANLPEDAIVEVPCYADRHGINIPRVGALPLGCAAVCNASISVQRLAVAAATSGDDTLLRQAFMMDPLVGAVCTPPEIWQMVDEMLVAHAQWLPQYGPAIAAAKARLANGLAVPVRTGYQGAARVPTKSVAQLRSERDAARSTAHAASANA